MAEPSEDLQKAVLTALQNDAAVLAAVDGRIYDGVPKDKVFPYVTFGPGDFVPEDMDGIIGQTETLQLDCWVRDGARLRPAKALASKVARALRSQPLALETHALANLQIGQVRAFMDRDGLTGHGIVTVEALIEVRT